MRCIQLSELMFVRQAVLTAVMADYVTEVSELYSDMTY